MDAPEVRPAADRAQIGDVLAPLLVEADADANVVGVFLKGSRAVGTDVADSDLGRGRRAA